MFYLPLIVTLKKKRFALNLFKYNIDYHTQNEEELTERMTNCMGEKIFLLMQNRSKDRQT